MLAEGLDPCEGHTRRGVEPAAPEAGSRSAHLLPGVGWEDRLKDTWPFSPQAPDVFLVLLTH